MTEGLVGSRVKIGAWLVAEDRDRAFRGSDEVENPLNEKTSIRVPIVSVDVRLTDQLGVQLAATVPDITRRGIVSRPTGAINFSETFQGLGDTSLLAWYRFAPINRWNIVANVGASLPTGRTEQPRFRTELLEGSLVPMSRLQRGSGTLDPLFGVNVDRRVGSYTFFSSIAARAPMTENEFGLRTGVSSEMTTGASHTLGHHRIAGYGRVGWLHREQDVFEGTPVLVGGGDWVYATPGVSVQVGKGFSVQAEVKLPVHRSLANHQLDSRAIWQFGVSRAF